MKHFRQPIYKDKRIIWLIILEGGSGPKPNNTLLLVSSTMVSRDVYIFIGDHS